MNKIYKKFHEIGNNNYYLLSLDGEIYIGTETYIEFERRFLNNILKPKRVTQGFKLLEMTPSLAMMFNMLMDSPVVNEDKDFTDMTKYEKIDNKKLRTQIKETYQSYIDSQLSELREKFDKFTSDLINKIGVDSDGNYDDVEFEREMKTPRARYHTMVEKINKSSQLNNIVLDVPRGNSVSPIITKMLSNGFEFLYTQKVGAFLEITYVYEMDCFGTITIYKIQVVKGCVKSIESFIYNIDIIREMVTFMESNQI